MFDLRETPPSLRETFLNGWKEHKDRFPQEGKTDYAAQLAQIEHFLNLNVHRNVEKMAVIHGAGFLTNHGPEHIADVIRQAGDLAAAIGCNLSGYEAYVLILAVHFHDVGNMFGREEHEKKISEVMESLGEKAGPDRPERLLIEKVARAHGGYADGAHKDRDTLRHIPLVERMIRAQVRPQLLAALLRFGDELAEDRTRADGIIYDIVDYRKSQGKSVSNIPDKSQAYHAYAQCLHSCVVDPHEHEIHLHYELLQADTQKKFTKGKKSVYLFDEIQARVHKLRTEMIYFSRHARGPVPLDRLSVVLEVLGGKYIRDPLLTLKYVFQDKGYPEVDPKTKVAQVLSKVERNGRDLDGRALAQEMRARYASPSS